MHYIIKRSQLTQFIADACDEANVKSWQRWLLMRVARKTNEVAFGTFYERDGKRKVNCPWTQAHLPIITANRKFYESFDRRCTFSYPFDARILLVTDLRVTSCTTLLCVV